MTSSRDADRILQALLEIAGEKYGAEIKVHVEPKEEENQVVKS